MKKLLSLMVTSLTILLLMLNCDDRKDMEIGEKPVASFIISDSLITPGTKVQFTDSSKNIPTSWSWEFGDGNQSSDTNASHIYGEAGTYTVNLTVGNNVGFNTMTKIIKVGLPPVAYFKANFTYLFSGNFVNFTDTSANSPTSWRWEFGDGNYSIEQNPSYKFNTIGTFDVTLIVSNMFDSDTLKKENYIKVTKIVIDTSIIKPIFEI